MVLVHLDCVGLFEEPGACAERGAILSKIATNKLERCQVRSRTDLPYALARPP